jgi:hypothetical protein
MPRTRGVNNSYRVPESKVLRLYAKGGTINTIARGLKCSNTLIWSILDKNGIIKRKGVHVKPQTVTIPKQEWKVGYLAGMIDGEGHISITNTTNFSGTYHEFIVGVSNTDVSLMQWLVKNFGGNYHVSKAVNTFDQHKRDMGFCKDIYKWHVQSTMDSFAILVAVKPYLVIKKGKAIKALRLLGLKIKKHKKWNVSPGYSP